MNLYLLHYAFGQSNYIWANQESDIKSPSQNHILRIEPISEIPVEQYVHKFDSLNWYRIDLDLWDDFNTQNLPMNEISNYYASFLNLEPYDKVGLQQENPQTIKRINQLQELITSNDQAISMVINYEKGSVSLIKKLDKN